MGELQKLRARVQLKFLVTLRIMWNNGMHNLRKPEDLDELINMMKSAGV